jgi:pyruvate,orthophosphate dikinase
MTSHAAVVGRGMGKACVVGCQSLVIDEEKREAHLGEHLLREGEEITLNGSTGEVYRGELPAEVMNWGKEATQFFQWADAESNLVVWANADTPTQAKTARELGAKGIGLCRTEHMFFEASRLKSFRKMILSHSTEERAPFIEELRIHQAKDFLEIFQAMNQLSVCVRLLDPPLHEFLPSTGEKNEIDSMAAELHLSSSDLLTRMETLKETNPMLGHRGCRLGITFPEIYRMQVRAIVEALSEHLRSNGKMICKIMIPLVMHPQELKEILEDLKSVVELQLQSLPKPIAKKLRQSLQWGTMIELPRACLVADEIAPMVDFVSFGTNDLTQTTLGISRDDSNRFLPVYIEREIFQEEPFESLDQRGVGQLVRLAVEKIRQTKPQVEIGVCGEHGGDPQSIEFFENLRFDSVSCSPFRVPIARLAAARSALDMSSRQKGRTRPKKAGRGKK